jgi:hypothetical protein
MSKHTHCVWTDEEYERLKEAKQKYYESLIDEDHLMATPPKDSMRAFMRVAIVSFAESILQSI